MRCGYSAPEEGSLFPLDGELNLPKDSYSHGLQERFAARSIRRTRLRRPRGAKCPNVLVPSTNITHGRFPSGSRRRASLNTSSALYGLNQRPGQTVL
jgi:hypothetical protein